jgi:hypothetical protein
MQSVRTEKVIAWTSINKMFYIPELSLYNYLTGFRSSVFYDQNALPTFSYTNFRLDTHYIITFKENSELLYACLNIQN